MSGADTPPAYITTDRLTIRPPTPGDASAIFHGLNDYEVVKNLGRAPWPYRPEDAESFVARAPLRDPAKERPLSIFHRQHGLIGGTGFHAGEGEPFSEAGIWLARPHWGKGYASEALSAVLGWASGAWGKRAIRAGHFVENEASGRALSRAGMLYTGGVEPLHCLARGEHLPARKMIWLA